MSGLLLGGAFALTVAGAVMVVGIGIRRLWLARRERRRAAVEARLRPVALALIDGEAVAVDDLDEKGAEILAGLLARYARNLSGTARAHTTAFFESGAHVAAQLRTLAGSRRRRDADRYGRAEHRRIYEDVRSDGNRPDRQVREPGGRAEHGQRLTRIACTRARSSCGLNGFFR